MKRFLLTALLSLLLITPTIGTENVYLQDLSIDIPDTNSKISVIIPKIMNEEEFQEALKESIKRGFSQNILSSDIEKIARETIAYTLASKFENALEKKEVDAATLYAISAILNGAHNIDNSFLYTLYDVNPQLIDQIEKVSNTDKVIAKKWDLERKIFDSARKTVDCLISFQDPDPYRLIK